MSLFTLLLMVQFVLAVMGFGWKTFSSGVISGSETILDVGQHIVRNLTQESEEYVNCLSLVQVKQVGANVFKNDILLTLRWPNLHDCA